LFGKKRRVVGKDEFVAFRGDYFLFVCGIKQRIGEIIVLKKLRIIVVTSLCIEAENY